MLHTDDTLLKLSGMVRKVSRQSTTVDLARDSSSISRAWNGAFE